MRLRLKVAVVLLGVYATAHLALGGIVRFLTLPATAAVVHRSSTPAASTSTAGAGEPSAGDLRGRASETRRSTPARQTRE